MATLQKFKLLATQCGVAPSPTRSPRTSPVVQLPRRKTTLRMLLSRNRSNPPFPPLIPSIFSPQKKDKKKEKEKDSMAVQSHTLRDLFVSSPPLEETHGHGGEMEEIGLVGSGGIGGGFDSWRAGPGSPKPVWNGFRYRSLLRRAWRPVLTTIPE